jgi:hypothetical protein
MTSRSGIGAGVALSVLIAFPLLAATPKLTAAQATALFKAAGFPLGADKHPVNRCGQHANPRVLFDDMNGDGRAEAIFIDQGGCYKPDGLWYAVATADADGGWRRVLEGEGRLKSTGMAFKGWFVLTVTSAGKTTRLHYNGVSYGSADAAAPIQNAGSSAKGGAYPTDGWKLPVTFAALPAPAQDSIMRAAGLTRSGAVWKGCEGTSEADAKSVEIKDLNHDGRPEAIVTDAGYGCYGNTGQEFTVLRATPDGWVQMMQVTGMIDHFMKSTGAGGYPDLMAGGPGTCVGVWRSDGSAYKILRRQEGNKDNGPPCHF